MAPTASPTTAPLILSAIILVAGAMGLLLFDAQGTSLFVALIETGMAWCF